MIKEQTDSTQHKCKFCPLLFETMKDYLSHIEVAHQSNKHKGFMCSVCAKVYKTKSELTQHINSKCGTLKQFTCKVCGQALMSAGSLYNHMLRHNGVRSFMCRFCAKLFFTAGQLKVHERIHTEDKAYVCEVCNKGFCHRQSLITHSTLHTGVKPYQCENCGNSFSCVGNLMKHRKTHADTCGLIPLTTHSVNNPATKIKVKINTPTTTRLKPNKKDTEVQRELDFLKTELYKQETGNIDEDKLFLRNTPKLTEDINATIVETFSKKEHTRNQKNINTEMKECENTPKENISSENEITNNENSPNSPVTIDQESPDHSRDRGRKRTKCTKRRPRFGNLLINFRKETDFDKNGYGDCKYCGKRYTNVGWLYKHIKEHEENSSCKNEQNVSLRLYKCSCCKMSFNTKEENLNHQQTNHADVLTCQECEKIFANRDSLRSHQKVFHQGVGRKTYLYICDKCGKQFKQKFYLKAHEERNCDKDPSYECTICRKQFSSIYTKNTHMRVHDSEKKLSCKFCSKSFHWKGQLKIHERSHTGEKPFACLYCPKAFAYRESLITHSSLHTGIKPHLCEGCGSRFSCVGNLIKHKRSHPKECGGWNYKAEK